MKKSILLIIIAVCGLAVACKKNHVAPGIVGKWELRRSFGGFSYADSTYAAGNGNIYLFNRDNTFKHFTKGVQDDQGTYQYKKGALPYSGYNYDALILNNNTPGELTTVNGTKLTLGTSVADGIQLDFEKISN